MWATGADAAKIVQDRGLAQVSDTGAISAVVAEVLTANDAMVQRYLNGEEKVFGALVGMCMKALKGKGNPAVVNSLLKEQLAAKKN
jgi:aspartyl-tRNA(Asn)/glutamyl-tRNA(Gln) amidotransferase subunit B